MTAEQSKLPQPRSQAAVAASFFKMRSEVIDAFAIAEAEITKYIIAHSSNSPCLTMPMALKIDLALKVKAGPQRSKALKNNADMNLREIRGLLVARAAIVHSKMTLAQCFSGSSVAIFQNAKDVAMNSSQAFVFSESDFCSFVGTISLSTKKLIVALTAKNQIAAPFKALKVAK